MNEGRTNTSHIANNRINVLIEESEEERYIAGYDCKVSRLKFL
jgi:hypothetical protein